MNGPGQRLIMRFSIFAVVAYALCFLILGLLVFRHQYGTIFEEKISAGKLTLGQIAHNAVTPLVQNDALSLNTLVKGAAVAPGLLYVSVVDGKGIVKAHTDLSRIGQRFEKPAPGAQRTEAEEGNATYTSFTLPSGTRVLDLSKPVSVMNRSFGEVHVGLSVNAISEEARKKASSLIWIILPVGIAVLLVLIIAALFVQFRLKRQTGRGTYFLSGLYGLRTDAGTGESGSLLDHWDQGQEHVPTGEDGPWTGHTNRNQVTVLFAGIKGFKAYAETKDPQEILKDLNEYLGIATSCIQQFGGYVDKFVGDAVIAVFGQPPLQAGHTERAVSAAVAMQEALQGLAQKGSQLLLRVGIGISSGVVLSGHVGSHTRKELIFIGESFKVAYSLNVLAGPGEIVMSRDVYQSVEDVVSVEPVPPRDMMQRTESWESFRLIEIIERKTGEGEVSHSNPA